MANVEARLTKPRIGGVKLSRGRNLQLLVGTGIVGAICVVAVFAPLLTAYDPMAQDLTHRLGPAFWSPGFSLAHPLGMDGFGRDEVSRLMFGARYSLGVAVSASIISAVVGVGLVLVAGYRGGWTGALLMRTVDSMQGLPAILVALMVVASLGQGIVKLTLVLALTGWPIYGRVLLGSVQEIRSREFITAAVGMGSPGVKVAARHILPNLMGGIVVLTTLQVARMLLLEAGLSFLGLGLPASVPAWGTMLADGEAQIFNAPRLVMIPGLAITITVWGINMIGEGLRVVADRRLG